jgi:hypothetical protein
MVASASKPAEQNVRVIVMALSKDDPLTQPQCSIGEYTFGTGLMSVANSAVGG